MEITKKELPLSRGEKIQIESETGWNKKNYGPWYVIELILNYIFNPFSTIAISAGGVLFTSSNSSFFFFIFVSQWVNQVEWPHGP